jgi:hypothetical protein
MFAGFFVFTGDSIGDKNSDFGQFGGLNARTDFVKGIHY